MQAVIYRTVLVPFPQNVSVCNYCFETKLVLKPLRGNQLNAGIYDGKKQRSLHYAASSFEFTDSTQQIFFFNFEAHANHTNQHNRRIKNVSPRPQKIEAKRQKSSAITLQALGNRNNFKV